jgi:hypothetical protein
MSVTAFANAFLLGKWLRGIVVGCTIALISLQDYDVHVQLSGVELLLFSSEQLLSVCLLAPVIHEWVTFVAEIMTGAKEGMLQCQRDTPVPGSFVDQKWILPIVSPFCFTAGHEFRCRVRQQFSMHLKERFQLYHQLVSWPLVVTFGPLVAHVLITRWLVVFVATSVTLIIKEVILIEYSREKKLHFISVPSNIFERRSVVRLRARRHIAGERVTFQVIQGKTSQFWEGCFTNDNPFAWAHPRLVGFGLGSEKHWSCCVVYHGRSSLTSFRTQQRVVRNLMRWLRRIRMRRCSSIVVASTPLYNVLTTIVAEYAIPTHSLCDANDVVTYDQMHTIADGI